MAKQKETIATSNRFKEGARERDNGIVLHKVGSLGYSKCSMQIKVKSMARAGTGVSDTTQPLAL